MDCECKFEAKVPIECVKHLIAMVKSGQYGRGELLCHAGCALGQIGALVAKLRGGDDASPFGGCDGELPDTLEGCCRALKEAVGDGELAEAHAANPLIDALIAKLIELLIEKIKEWLEL